MIETCVYINVGLRETLNQSARNVGLSRNALAHLLFSRVLKEKRLLEPSLFTRVKYQAVDPSREWTTIGIDLEPEMFEKCQDLRKVLRMSVSLILSYAIRTYLNQIIDEYLSGSLVNTKTGDNYVPFYSMQSIFHDDVEGFIIKWKKNPDTMPWEKLSP